MCVVCCFFFQAEDGIRDYKVTGVQTCALPIWMANQTLERALTFAGYEVQHVWGEGAHNQKHSTAIFPDAMRWLWKDWPQPVKAGQTKNQVLSDILIPGQDWRLVSEGYRFTEGPAANAKGEVFFSDIPASKAYKIGLDGKASVFVE